MSAIFSVIKASESDFLERFVFVIFDRNIEPVEVVVPVSVVPVHKADTLSNEKKDRQHWGARQQDYRIGRSYEAPGMRRTKKPRTLAEMKCRVPSLVSLC